jgi:hypothetical protein
MADQQQRVTLPPELIASIKTISSDATLSASSRLTGVLMLIWGWTWYQGQATIDPSMVALPDAQWQEVCGLLNSGVPEDPITRVNLGLSFMNSGPTAYTE